MIYDIDFDNNENIHIHQEDNICTVCGKHWLYRKRCTLIEDYPGMKEIEFITSHASCRSLMRKKKDLDKAILDIEFKIFNLKNRGL